MTRSNASGSTERSRPAVPMPALAKRTSMPPNRSTVRATASSSAPRSVMSHSIASARSAPISAASRSSSSGSSPTRATFAPLAASLRAASAPIPRAAPVMRTVLPFMSPQYASGPRSDHSGRQRGDPPVAVDLHEPDRVLRRLLAFRGAADPRGGGIAVDLHAEHADLRPPAVLEARLERHLAGQVRAAEVLEQRGREDVVADALVVLPRRRVG